jgi:GT2 family glycosyltransferase
MPIYNQLALTRDAIASCLAQDIPGGVRVLCVIDRGDDGVAQWLRSQGKAVQVVEAPGCGVSKAWNLALGHVFDALGGEHALVANSDVKLRPDTYRRLVDDGGKFVTCVGTSSGAKFPGGDPDPKRVRPHPDFSCFLLRRDCWREVGTFDDRMRIYCSDGDYHLRMHHQGICAYCLDLPFWHYASGSLKQTDPDDRERILKIAGQDREVFHNKWRFEMGGTEYYAAFAHKEEAPLPEPLLEENTFEAEP